MNRRRLREGAHNCVEHHFSQVDQPMFKFGMHFYGMGGPLYTRKVAVGEIRTFSEFELG